MAENTSIIVGGLMGSLLLYGIAVEFIQSLGFWANLTAAHPFVGTLLTYFVPLVIIATPVIFLAMRMARDR